MKITNDHYGHLFSGAWRYDEREVFVTDDNGQTWRITASTGGGIQITALGSGIADDQIHVLPRVSNAIVLRSTQPD